MALSPMMREYLNMKEVYPDCILMYRVGDFYEMFFEDARTISQALELTLTGKECGLEERAPMCGVPYHALDTYVNRMINQGFKVAICDQVEDPKTAKGLVKREVTRIITPGTNLDMTSLEEGKNNFLMCIVVFENRIGVASADISTGEFLVTEVPDIHKLKDEIQRFSPSEIICNNAFLLSGFDVADLKDRLGIMVSAMSDAYFSDEAAVNTLKDHFHVLNLSGLGLDTLTCGINAAGGLLSYLLETQMNGLSHMNALRLYHAENYMVLDSATMRNLELTETLREKMKRGSLLWVLDHTKTAMGARLLRASIEQPLIDEKAILERLDAVEALNDNEITCEELREYLNPIYDLERLVTRVSYGTANPRDLVALKTSLEMLPAVIDQVGTLPGKRFKALLDELDDLSDLTDLIDRAIKPEPPMAMKEGGIIRDGYNADVDDYRVAGTEGRRWLAELEEREREATGIHTLKIKFSRLFGYVLEVTNSFKDKVPEHYIRKQTLTNAERYTTPELKGLEDKILGSQDKLFALEYQLYTEVRDHVASQMGRIQKTARAIAEIDMLASFSYISRRNHYVRPNINNRGIINIKDGRHPVVENMLRQDTFIPNDTQLDSDKKRLAIITGPNMAGKSTYMRQSALIVLMAQIGCFVPAKKADICLVDRIFTRVGASDDLSSGQSTFMVEMSEVANILRNATSRSLIILDEIGRGTSTFDGLSIAWAVVEYIADKKLIGAKTLFATHYHELTELEGKIGGVSNYCIAVKEKADGIIFLRKIIKGSADKSYGIEVARLAGVPEAVLTRAHELVGQLSDADITEAIDTLTQSSPKKSKPVHYDDVDLQQMSLLAAVPDESVLEELKTLDITTLTPLDALNTLYKLQNKLNNRWGE
ncbi:MAG: DNA mismatch repair protein MutS [Lachnospiraceae bacterium]|nr:DNA mismatch repair protein MutS [Lachnospiraceae bacterium]